MFQIFHPATLCTFSEFGMGLYVWFAIVQSADTFLRAVRITLIHFAAMGSSIRKTESMTSERHSVLVHSIFPTWRSSVDHSGFGGCLTRATVKQYE